MPEPRALTVAQLRALCLVPDPATLRGLRDRAFLATLLATGLAVEALVQLAVAQLVPGAAGGMLQVPGADGQPAWTRPLSLTAWQWTAQWIAARPCPSPWLFTAFAGRGARRSTDRAMSVMAAYKLLRQSLDAARLDQVRPHDLRQLSVVVDLLDVVITESDVVVPAARR